MTLSVLETSLPMQRSHDTLASSIWAKNWFQNVTGTTGYNCIKLIFMYFLFNADLSKFDSQYYNIRYIHSLLLNSGPWTKTIKTSTFNFKHKTEQGQSQASKKHLILSQHQCDLCLPVCHLPHHYHTSVLSSEMKENRKNCVWNMSIIALVLAFQRTWSDIQK